MVKEKDIFYEVARDLPEGATAEEIIREVYMRVCVLRGLKDYKEGKTISLEEARRKWENVLKNK